MRTIRWNTRSAPVMISPATVEAPISLPRTRLKLCALVMLASGSAISDTSHWVTFAMSLACLAVPLAVAALGGIEMVRALFFIATGPLPAGTARPEDLSQRRRVPAWSHGGQMNDLEQGSSSCEP